MTFPAIPANYTSALEERETALIRIECQRHSPL